MRAGAPSECEPRTMYNAGTLLVARLSSLLSVPTSSRYLVPTETVGTGTGLAAVALQTSEQAKSKLGDG